MVKSNQQSSRSTANRNKLKKGLYIALFNWRDVWHPKSGGAEYVTLKHAQFWAKKGHTVIWFTSRYSGSKARERKNGILYVRFGFTPLFFCVAPFLYWSYGGKFDVVIDEIHGLPMFAPLWAWRSKVVAFIHEVAQEIWTEMYPFPIGSVGQMIERFWLRLYQVFCVPFWVDCQGAKDDLVTAGIASNLVTVIPCAIERPPRITTQKEKHLTLIFLARLVKMKGVETAMAVFAKVLKKNAKAQLWIVGSGDTSYVVFLQSEARRLGIATATTFWGRVSQNEKFSLLKRAHFLLHTSVREGFGLTVLEAGSQGTPTVSFDVSALRELVENNKTGFLVSPGNIKKMAEVVLKAIGNKKMYTSLSQKAKEFEKTFRWEKFIKMSEDLLLTVASSKSSL